MATTRDEMLLKKFLDATGYEKEDVLALNPVTLHVVTQYGSKYILQKGQFRRLLGPPSPQEIEDGKGLQVEEA